MPKFYMTDDEIRRDYTKAKDRKRQLGILADMNCVSKAAMRNKLIELGLILGTPTEEKPKKVTVDQKIDEGRARALIAGDVRDEDIAKEFGVSVKSFQSWRRGKGIMRYPQSQKKEGKTMEERAAERALQESAVEPPTEVAARSGGKIGMEPRAISLGLFLAKITELAPPAVLKAPLRINGVAVGGIREIAFSCDGASYVNIQTTGNSQP